MQHGRDGHDFRFGVYGTVEQAASHDKDGEAKYDAEDVGFEVGSREKCATL